MFKVVGPSDIGWQSAEWHTIFRRLGALASLSCFLFAVISISDHHFSSRGSQGDRNCKILKGCLDSEDESRKIAAPVIVSAASPLFIPALQFVALVPALELSAPKLFLPLARQGRAPPVAAS